jgi:tripartite ATP-independent transporter DctM subunit
MNSTPFYLFSNYTLSVIPLFILMGAIAERSGLSTRLFTAAASLVGHRRGGMAMALIGACTAFGAICGSSVATTATFARATLPEFKRYRYDSGFATGTVAVGGTLGILIPPSIILVVYAITTEQNIAKLFKAALIPGLLAAVFYCIVIALLMRVKPQAGPAHAKVEGWARVATLLSVWPVVLVAIVVVGGIYGGVFTPTEGAAVGAIAMLAIAVLQRSLNWADFKDSLLQTADTSAMIFAIILGRISGALAASDQGGRACHLDRPAALRHHGGIAAVLHPARRGDGRTRHDPADAAGVFSDRGGARFRTHSGRNRDLVRHSGLDRGRHRADLSAHRPQCIRGLGDCA